MRYEKKTILTKEKRLADIDLINIMPSEMEADNVVINWIYEVLGSESCIKPEISIKSCKFEYRINGELFSLTIKPEDCFKIVNKQAEDDICIGLVEIDFNNETATIHF
jgi:hypothetical protein